MLADAISHSIPGFHIIRRIGRGGMAEVFEGARVGPSGFRRPVALKRLSAAGVSSEKAIQRFLREARISARLDHRNIVRVEELVVAEDGYFIVMELLRGHELLDVCKSFRRGTIPPWVVLSVASQTLDALAYAHAMTDEEGKPVGLVHRDLTPRNIFICQNGTVKVLDFGIVKLRRSLTIGLTQEGLIQGTLEFISPEQARADDVDARSDIFQLAATMFYMLTGEPPRGRGSAAQLIERAIHEQVRRVDLVRSDVPKPLAALIAQALELDPKNRFRDANEMRQRVDELLADATGGIKELAELVASLEDRDKPAPAPTKHDDSSDTKLTARPDATSGQTDPSSIAPTPLTDPFIGHTLGGYRVREKIGMGGSGVVYRAEQADLSREVALKLLRVESPEVVQRFLKEAQLASKLDHPYAAHVYGFGTEAGQNIIWLAMEFVRGMPLDEHIDLQGPMPLDRFIPFFERLCEVIQTAHDQGIIHGDIKPSNVMILTRAGRPLPKLLDLGTARILDRSAMARAAAMMGVTPQGPAVGTPAYMAPEMWTSGSMDTRSDLYALAILAYETLTGRAPFETENLVVLAQAHMREPVPPLEHDLPQALHAVMAKALAKRPDDRYQSAMELLDAFRVAAGWAADVEHVPKIEPELSEVIVQRAPQPISEAMTALDVVRNALGARDAFWQMVDVLVQYMGTLALACRVHAGPGEAIDSHQALDLMAKLRRSRLATHEWVAMARELSRGFAHRSEAHPIPELVSFFFPPDSSNMGVQAKLLETLAARRPPPATTGGSTSEQDALAELGTAIPELETILRSLSLLVDYRLVVPRRVSQAEEWTGVRRAARNVVPYKARLLKEGRPALVDADGWPVVVLWPFAQVSSPTPGAPEELFLIQARARHGALLSAPPLGFERFDEELWQRSTLFSSDIELLTASEQDRPPYHGLSAFRPEDAADFVGREREVEALINRLRIQDLLAVVGPSGTGKSSFVQAGVVASLGAGWRSIIVRPGAQPIGALLGRLEKDGVDVTRLGREVRLRPEALGDQLRARATASQSQILLVVDQFEELVTLCGDAEEREAYAEMLVRAVRSATDPVRVVVTLRDDFLVRCEQVPALRDRLSRGLKILTTPAAEDLLRILVEPARRIGYEFEDPEMPAQMVAAVRDQQGALALLSFTATKLWELRDRQFRKLTRKAYHSLGGVGGALAQHAEQMLTAMSEDEQKVVREAFRRLLTADGTRAVVARTELLEVLGDAKTAGAVLEKLIGARLLQASEGEKGQPDRIEMIHEALISAWPRLVQWRSEDAENARMRDQLRNAARQWQERERAGGLLWRDDALVEYQVWRKRYPGALTQVEEAFAAASLAEASAWRRRKRILLGAAFTILAVGMVVLFQMNRRTAKAEATTARRLAENHYNQGRQLFLAGDHLRSLPYLVEAFRHGVTHPGIRLILAQVTAELESQHRVLRGHEGQVFWAAYTPDGQQILTAGQDGTWRIWDASTGRSIDVIRAHAKGVRRLDISPDGARVATASEDGTAKLWDLRSRRLIATLEHGATVWWARFSPDGRALATGGSDKTARLWNGLDGSPIAQVSHPAPLQFLAWDRDGSRVASADAGGTVKIWNTQGKVEHALSGHKEMVRSALFSPDGRSLVTASDDRTARIWDVSSGNLKSVLQGHSGVVRAGVYSPDGSKVATTSEDGTVRIWTASGELVRTLLGHRGYVAGGAWSRDGNTLMTWSVDATTILWSMQTGAKLVSLQGHTSTLFAAQFSPDERAVVTASGDGSARIWRPKSGGLATFFQAHAGKVTDLGNDWNTPGPVTQLGFCGPTHVVLSAGVDGQARLWDADTGKMLRAFSLDGGEVRGAACSANGKTLVAGSTTGRIREWDLETGAIKEEIKAGSELERVAFSRDQALIAAATKEHRILAGDRQRGGTLEFLGEMPALIRRVELGANGEWVLAQTDVDLRLWNLRSRSSWSWSGGSDEISWSGFTVDGRAVMATSDGHARIWTLDGRPMGDFSHSGWAFHAAPSPNSKHVVVPLSDGTSTVWDLQKRTRLGALERHVGRAYRADYTSDGQLVVTTGGDLSVKVWNPSTFELLSSFEGHPSDVSELVPVVSADGQRLVTGDDQGWVFVWRLDLAKRTGDELSQFLRCHDPFQVGGSGLISAHESAFCPSE